MSCQQRGQSKAKANKSTTPSTTLFSKERRWVALGFKPTALGECSTNWPTETTSAGTILSSHFFQTTSCPGIQTNDTLQSRWVLNQLTYQDNFNWHNTFKPLFQTTIIISNSTAWSIHDAAFFHGRLWFILSNKCYNRFPITTMTTRTLQNVLTSYTCSVVKGPPYFDLP